MEEKIIILDTTLRDGEQSPGATLTSTEKIKIAHGLAKLGVDVIEAGFPASSPDDLEAVRLVAQEVGNRSDGSTPPIICGLARAIKNDIDKAWEAVKPAKRPRIHTFIASSDIHMKHKLQMPPEKVVKIAAEMVAYARSLCEDVEFSPEDAGRSRPEFLYEILGEAIKAGATTINIPDTVGYTTPDEFADLIRGIIQNTPGIENCVVSVHCHNDLGLATANTLAAIRAGARQAEVTINGIGERAGNCALEELVMALHTRRSVYGYMTGINTTQITHLSRMVSNYTGIHVQPNKAIVGANAFAHEAGIHQDGLLKNKQTYEIMTPASVGLKATKYVLGKHSGRHALKIRLEELGYELDEEHLQQVFERFKDLADKKKEIHDVDLEALVSDEILFPEDVLNLYGLQVTCGTMSTPNATVRLSDAEGKIYMNSCGGSGPIDASFNAINNIIKAPCKLTEFYIHANTEGRDAIGEVSVRIESDLLSRTDAESGEMFSRSFSGYGADTDIVVASVKAYLSALNKLLIAADKEQKRKKESSEVPGVKSPKAGDGVNGDYKPQRFSKTNTIPEGWIMSEALVPGSGQEAPKDETE